MTMFATAAADSRLVPVLRRGVVFLAIAGACWFVVDAAMRLLGASLDTEPTVTVSTTAGQTAAARGPRAFQDYLAIVQRNLFGEAALKKPPPPKPPEAPPPPKPVESLPKAAAAMNLQLYGTVIAPDGKDNMAFILDKTNNNEAMFRAGDKIRNIQVRRIERFFVVVSDGGPEAVLTMEIAQPITPEPPATSPPPPPSAAAPAAPAPPKVTASPENIERLMREAQFVPITAEGKTTGYRLTGIKPNSIYDTLKLQNNDVVLAINNQPVSSPTELMRLYQQLGGQNQVTLHIQRGEQQQNLVVMLQH